MEAVILLAAATIENPRLDAELMLAEACKSSRAAVISGFAEINDSVAERYAAMISRRAGREPLAYILGRKEFYSLELEVSPAVLIPRPETEILVGAALQHFGGSPSVANGCGTVLDVGTGSGAIALSIAANAPAVRITATDVSVEALAVARRNAVNLDLLDRVRFRLADCFETLDGLGPLGRFHLVLSNPPYIRDSDISGLAPEIVRYEPRRALAGGGDGMDFYRRIISALPSHLEPGGTVLFEIGVDQATPVSHLLRNSGAVAIKLIPDLAGLPRVMTAKFPG